ncbi:MAG: molecular chaperone DnaJ [Rhodospirillales bacterium]|nr:molecular chaperone DnaJ [Rhodospirillales bacterium]
MLSFFILGIAILAGLLLAGQWFTSADPKTLIKALKWLLFSIIGVVIVFFALTGRIGWAFASLPALVPWLLRARALHQIYLLVSSMWRSRGGAQGSAQGSGGPQSGTMTRVQALEILGLKEGCSKQEIKAAHHRLISGLHPDRGGSNYLAAQINQAKDVLLG